MKIRLLAAEFSHADGQTENLDADNRFSQFSNTPENTSDGQTFQKLGPMYIMQDFTI